MRARLCAAMLCFEAILLGLSVPVMITVDDVDRSLALWLGLGLCVACLLVAGMLRRPGGLVLGHALQVAAIALGFLTPAMFFVGALFAALWFGAYFLGRTIDDDRARWTAEAEQDTPDEGPLAGEV
ncbi:DUF4233 domain-containing protein [Aeromicrobium sp. Leaf350]|uniref:DUF4233 domain-containing protein n=1 Tax=Aeromicrobium sp. Leaf350 TaxID=2876565 RepID=UPI001E2D97D8|nr:DUF4233 domain-containing protein [Aeromicrobium sp. Leaf350]